jgi:hypothetical protein
MKPEHTAVTRGMRAARASAPTVRTPRRSAKRAIPAITAATIVALAASTPAGAGGVGSLTMGPQSMEGNLRVAPGTELLAGYDFTIPGTHPAATIEVDNAQISFVTRCADGTQGSVTVTIPDASYTDPANSPSWYPSGDQHSSLVYQGEVAVPDVCNGGTVGISNGLFTASVSSDVAVSKVNARWHYSADGTSGSWSGTASVTPTIGTTGGGGSGGGSGCGSC